MKIKEEEYNATVLRQVVGEWGENLVFQERKHGRLIFYSFVRLFIHSFGIFPYDVDKSCINKKK